MSFAALVIAKDRVEQRLKRVTAALNQARIPYAVIGGNAVASWVGRVAPSATRATKDGDLLVRRSDLARTTGAMHALGFTRRNMRSLVLFLDPEKPDERSGAHLIWAGARVRPSYAVPAPD